MERREQIPQIDDHFRLSHGAKELLQTCTDLDIDPTQILTQALSEADSNGKRTITRKHLNGLKEKVEIARNRHPTRP